jgi:molybdate transport system substrate-binding protein
MSEPLQLMSSMATRLLLADLVDRYLAATGTAVQLISVGGVEAARRVTAGEALDAVVLARPAIASLAASGHVLPASPVDLADSGVAVAVRAGADLPDIGSTAALMAAVLAAPRIAVSTGPSGLALTRLFERWGIAAEVAPRTVTAPPGVPVGSLLARGEVDLGFQQLSELMHLDGITLVGPLPAEVQITTTFTGAVASTCTGARPDAVRTLLRFLAAPEQAALKREHGMAPPAS